MIRQQLNAEWATLAHRPVPGPLRPYGADGAAVLARIHAQPEPTLRGLVALAQGGITEAGRVVVQALLPKLILMAARDRRAELADYVSHLWLCLHRHPLNRQGSVAGNLVLDTLKAVRRDARPLAPLPPPEPGPPPGEAARVLAVARDSGLVTELAASILADIYLDGHDRPQVAARHHLTEPALRQQCSRAVRKLAGHRDALVAA